MFRTKLINKVEEFVRKMFEDIPSDIMVYHNIKHTLDVVTSAEEIAINENLSGEDLELLLIAAWFHDTGHFQSCYGHEELSSKIAIKFLEKEQISEEKISRVVECINSTKIPQSPKTPIAKILCDADLHHLGLPDLSETSQLLRLELERRGVVKYSDKEWSKLSLQFLKSHNFFTVYAKSKFETQKQLNIIVLENKIEKFELSDKQS